MKKAKIATLAFALALCLLGILLASTFAALTSSVTIQSSGSIGSGANATTFGYNTVGGSTDIDQIQHACRFVCPQSGVLNGLVWYVAYWTGSSANYMKAAVYSDNNGACGVLLAQSSPVYVSNSAGGWVTFPLSVSVISGRNYWFSILPSKYYVLYYNAGSTGQDEWSWTGTNPYPNFPSPFFESSSDNLVFSVYATYGTGSSSYTPTVGRYTNGTYWFQNDLGIITTDHSYASILIQNAINDASNINSGLVNINAGAYVLNQTLYPVSNVYLHASSGATIEQNQPSSLGDSISLMLTANGGINNFTINGGIWNGNKGSLYDDRTTSTWSSYFFQYLGISIYSSANPSSKITVENLEVENVIGQGIDLLGCKNTLVYNCTTINDGDNPITLDTDSSNCTVNACTDVGGQDVGINTWQATNCIIENCHVSNVTEDSNTSHWGIAAEQSNHIQILNNFVSLCPYNIVDTSNNTVIEGNSINGGSSAVAAISIQVTYNTFVADNSITGMATGGPSFAYCISTWTPITQTYNLTLQGNTGEVNDSHTTWYNLNVAISGGGTLSESDTAFDSSLASINGNNYQFESGDSVTLTAYSNSGQTLQSITLNGNSASSPLSVVMSGTRSVVASFSGSSISSTTSTRSTSTLTTTSSTTSTSGTTTITTTTSTTTSKRYNSVYYI